MSIHSLKRECANLAWDNSIPPALHVKSGDEITFDCLDASNGQLTAESTVKSLGTLDFALLDQVNGPVYVDGAQPGDTLQVDVLRIENPEWGWTALIPGFGLLADEFTAPALKIWKLESDSDSEEGFAWFDKEKGMKVPLRPFAGEMGVVQKKKGAFSTIPPYHTGGNIDTKHVTVGSTLFLPIEVEGALFSIGDGHAAQGDGEVCGTAIETPMKVTVRLSVRKDKPYTKTPHFSTPVVKHKSEEEYYCTTGVDSDMREATRSAVRNMIEFLVAEYGLDRVGAYMLCSVAGDLRMHEVVDMPNYVIGMMIPKSVLGPSVSNKA
ncbi:Acetamidase/Formamidase [Rhizopogon vinicolor AM-OR11-026]|uniref:Acetamidase/Formamidase n=1 Tax=Rhizopogon vinicolor AM-OR11-026 TaxID=1314800 RepID=A0A1B7MZD8_9AGAM|nr:Acetamidase/Formamidase [Rhizopogon vinicolor AM-OR11-026]